MRIAIIGTRRLAVDLAKGATLADLDVVMGSGRPQKVTGLTAPVTDISSAIIKAELVINALSGDVSVEVLTQQGMPMDRP